MATNSPGNLHPLENRRRGYGVWGRNNCTENQRCGPWEAGNQRMRHQRHRNGRCEYETEGQERDCPHISPEIAPRGKQCCRVKQRWQEHEQSKFGVKTDMRQEWNQAQGEAAENEKHRIRQTDPPSDNVQRSDDHQQKADELYLSHILTKKDFPMLGKKCA
jgi:hypothetical protein